MAKALPSGRPVRRPLFGALDPDGWTWAGIKAMFWFIVLILALGYIPDRAYYFTVNKTIDIGVLAWSPINLCPAENRGLPCPAPAGAMVPWEAAPTQLTLPEPRTAGAAAQLVTHLLYAGGSGGAAPTTSVFVSEFKDGAFGPWANGPALPEGRAEAGIVVLSGVAYLVGGVGPDGQQPTNTVWSLKADAAGALTTWAPVEGVTLPAARAGAGVVALSDGILVVGGRGPDGKPTTTVWKSTLDPDGVLGAFAEQPALVNAVAETGIALNGDYVWVFGGTDATGASKAVQRGHVGVPQAAEASPSPGASAAPAPQGVLQWAVSDGANLPEARSAAATFAANGTLYVVGGSDGLRPRREMYWAVPDAVGNLTGGWHYLDKIDLPGGIQGGSSVVSGSYAYVIGGSTDSGPSTNAVRANLAPQPPFFQLGIAGLTVPALAIPGEIGQNLGYLAAAGVGTGNFVILCAVAWMYSNKPKVRAWWERRRASRRGRRAAST
ncbi:MAG TPA: hypothetical protein VEX41_10245 [Candidatus Eisenbacteria bacterium]|nr:hypothetical protein [Candidatus Eisenbacteria bacterium]